VFGGDLAQDLGAGFGGVGVKGDHFAAGVVFQQHEFCLVADSDAGADQALFKERLLAFEIGVEVGTELAFVHGLLDFLGEANVGAPPALALTASFAVNASLRRALVADIYDSSEVARLLRRSEIDHVKLDTALLSFTSDKRMKRAMVKLESAMASEQPQNVSVLYETLAIAESLRTLPMDVNLWQAQNIWNDLLRRSDNSRWSREWREGFYKLGLALNISVDDLVVEEGVSEF